MSAQPYPCARCGFPVRHRESLCFRCTCRQDRILAWCAVLAGVAVAGTMLIKTLMRMGVL